MTETLDQQLIRHEGICLYPYDDKDGKRVGHGYKQTWDGHLTIGVGLNLETGITEHEAMILLRLRIERIRGKLRHSISFFDDLSEHRQNVLVNMAYNMGITGLLGFERMLAALEVGDFARAAEEMKNSKWEKQLPVRVKELAEVMRCDI